MNNKEALEAFMTAMENHGWVVATKAWFNFLARSSGKGEPFNIPPEAEGLFGGDAGGN